MSFVLLLLITVPLLFYIGRIMTCVKGIKRWIYIEVVYNLFIKILIGYYSFPSILNYLSDLILIYLLITLFFKKKKMTGCKWFNIFIGIYFLVTLISYIANLYNPLFYLWGFRNNFRFLLFAYVCISYLDKNDIINIYELLFGVFFVNILVTTYQFLFLDNILGTGDAISGLFSMGLNQSGGNSALNWLVCIVCTFSLVLYLNKKESLSKLLIVVFGSLYMAVISELKIFFIEIVIIAIIAMIISRKSLKLVMLSILGVIGLYYGVHYLYILFPKFDSFFTLDNIKNYSSSSKGYVGVGSINRLTSFSYVFNQFLKDPIERIIGIGFGNADYSSSFTFLTSDFYNRYSWTAYQYFYMPFILIETGILGVITYMAIYINYLVSAIKLTSTEETKSLKSIAIIISVLSIFLLFYNQSLKIETSGYMVHLMLVIPFILYKETNKFKSFFKIKLVIGRDF